jgi:transcription antitermination factor NusG
MSNQFDGLTNSTPDRNTSQPVWFAIHTRHQHEKVVAQILGRKGFETFLPLYAAAHRWKDRTKVLSLPLFTCYVFLKGDLGRRLEVATTPGVHAIVSYGGKVAVIPACEIEALQRVVASGLPIEPHPFLKCGEQVRIRCGPLAGLQGILERKRNLYRLVLSVEMLGKGVAVEVDAFLVERVKSDRAAPGPSTARRSEHRQITGMA